MIHRKRTVADPPGTATPWKRTQALIVVVTTGVLLLFSISCSQDTPGKSSSSVQKPVSARVIPVESKQIRRNIESVGSLFAYEEVTVSSEVEGRVDDVLVDVGDRVARGQAMVKVSPVELQYALDQQRAALRQARARLGLSEDGPELKDVRDAAEVKKAAADLNEADQKFRRAKAMMDQGLLPQQNFDEVESKYKSARAAYDLAVQTVENIRHQVSQYRATVALAQKKLADAVIRAPFPGQIKVRSVTPGQYLKVQTPVMVIVNIDPLRVRLKVPEKMAAWLKANQEVTLSVEAYPDRTFSGKISRINPSVDEQTRSFEVEALIINREGLLKPGFFVKASIPSDRVESGLFVPYSALQYVYGLYKVYTVEGNLLKERDVKIGERSGDQVEIVEGISAVDRVALPAKGQVFKDRAPIEAVP
ncbi:MAG: efflux RND transporter periplasmic adaptor subunit [Acidobacteriia bacterium]|nr:efflux RND transporter periplasmic adaptor subunit [Terriglobia bacterium]